MRLLMILLLSVSIKARHIEKECKGIVVNDILQKEEILKAHVISPYQLAMDYDTNTLFFSYSTEDSSVFQSAYLNLKTNEFGNIPGIAGGFANAVDNKKNTVYLGGRDGIYEFNYNTKTAQRLNVTDDNIWQLIYKDKLYYSKYPEEHAYVFQNGKFQRVPELINTRAMLLCVDDYNNIYFSNSSGLFIHKKSNDAVNHIGDFNVNGFTYDVHGDIYFSTPDGIFSIDVAKKEVKNVAKIENVSVYGVAIDITGNIIYASEDSIIRLKPTEKICPTDVATVTFY
ncbi:ommochrome-binding protein [Pieris rapae]|uniref:ommochrome-binding protein n=1 Tax=Pieris rapae TaxID=64459 RepID=UPI001E2800F9|nr:ommochrome-binding protein [Pieris rapae]XP_045484945.1 ommochrome-binding protein [Pieris rapae]